MRYPSTAALVLRSVFILFSAVCLVLCGVVIDAFAHSGPAATVFFLFIGITFGVIMILVIIASSFGNAAHGDDRSNGEPPKR
jgi:F0F1-type ATP synthase assembly protein I